MDLNAISEMSPRNRRLLTIAGLIVIPTYVLPVGLFGVRGMRPRFLRDAVSGAITVGMLSLVGWSLSQVTRRRQKAPVKHVRPPEGQRWKLPIKGDILPEEMLGSAASGH